MSRSLRALTPVLLALAPPTLAAGNVLVVDASGGAAFTEISAAVAAAAAGDVVLVRSGTYVPFTVDGLSLTVAADLGANVRVDGGFPGAGGVRVANLAPGQSVVLRGLRVSSPGFSRALVVEDNQGSVLAEDCVFVGETAGGFTRDAVLIRNSGRATLVRCLALGGTGPSTTPFHGGHGLVVESSSAAHLYDCTLQGGCGVFFEPLMVGDGGDGGRVSGGSFLYASGSLFQGGDGAHSSLFCFPPDAGDGGAGLRLLGMPPHAELLATSTSGGLGGPGLGGCPSGADGMGLAVENGTAHVIPGVARQMSAAHPVREGQTLVFDFQGLAGDLIVVGLSDGQQPFFLPALEGTLVVTPAPLSTFVLGTLPAGGALTVNVTVPPVTGVQSSLFFAQLAVVTPTMPIDVRLGTGQSLLLLDAAF